MTDTPKSDDQKSRFLEAAAEPPRGFWAEYWLFVRQNKKWWLTPILLVLLLATLLAFTSSALGPFLYPGF